jgi:NAD(P)-dependent dehydrogenase (short-subunit alcohol dehydrogenase family)
LLDELAAKISLGNGIAVPVPADVSSPASVAKAFAEIDSKFGSTDFFFNCAGVVEPLAPLVECSDEDLQNSLAVNLLGVFLTTREAVTRMLNQGRGGTIVNITSGAARKPYAGWSAYCSQKAGVDQLTRCVALETKDTPVRIFAISPGAFESGMQEKIRQVDPNKFPSRQKYISLYKSGKLGSPVELARQFIDIALADWPELSGAIEDIRDESFRDKCTAHGIELG